MAQFVVDEIRSVDMGTTIQFSAQPYGYGHAPQKFSIARDVLERRSGKLAPFRDIRAMFEQHYAAIVRAASRCTPKSYEYITISQEMLAFEERQIQQTILYNVSS